MATFYIQLGDKLQKISGDLTRNNIIKALGYTPSDFSGNFNDLIDNPLTQDGNGEFKIVDEMGNIIATVNSEGIHSIDFVAGDHKLSNKADKEWVTEFVTETVSEGKINIDGYATESWVESKGYAKQEDLDNIDFNTLKNTPFSDDENGELNIVDENNNIGLRLNSDGLYVKDVIAGNNILSNKADKSEVPTSTSQLTNDSGYITKPVVDQAIASLVDSAPETLDTIGEIASALKNNANIVDVLNQSISAKQNTIEDLEAIRAGASLGATALQEIPEEYVTRDEIPNLPSLDEYAKKEDIPSLDGYATQAWVNNNNYATEEDLSSIEFNSLQNNPLVEDSNGEFNLVDDLGNVGFKVNQEGLFVKDVIAGDHMLSNKANISDIPESITESTVIGWGFTKNTGTYSKPATGIPVSDLAGDIQTSLGKANTALQSYTEQYKGTITGVSANGTSIATSGIANIPAASTSVYGVTKLSSATNSTSTSLAATASAVKAAYDLANSYKGTVTGVKINGTTKNPSSGVVDLGTVITAHQDISGKQDKLVSGTNIKTINGTSLLGSGDIVISGGGGSSSGSGAYSEVNHGTNDTTFTLTPNTFHIWDEVASLTLNLGSETSGVANEFLFQFTSGATATSLTLPDDIKWTGEEVPSIEANKIYQISILKGLGSVLEWDNAPTLIENKATLTFDTITFQYPVASELVIKVDTDTVTISAGEKSCQIQYPEPEMEIMSISPISDSTYYYTF